MGYSRKMPGAFRYQFDKPAVMKKLRILAFALSAEALCGCAAAPPRNINDICAIFEERPSWRRQAFRASERWEIPVPVLMAIIHQESSFRARARPARTRRLGIIPGPRPSSAYGYAQALDGTWRHYRRETGNKWASRRSFADAIDFVGWYCDRSRRLCGIGPEDAFNLYLAYHEGHGGYNRGTYRRKPWLIEIAERVARRAELYRRQLRRCPR